MHTGPMGPGALTGHGLTAFYLGQKAQGPRPKGLGIGPKGPIAGPYGPLLGPSGLDTFHPVGPYGPKLIVLTAPEAWALRASRPVGPSIC